MTDRKVASSAHSLSDTNARIILPKENQIRQLTSQAQSRKGEEYVGRGVGLALGLEESANVPV